MSIARLKVAESELSTQQEKNVLVAAEYSELVKNLEQRQREDSLQVILHGNKPANQLCNLLICVWIGSFVLSFAEIDFELNEDRCSRKSLADPRQKSDDASYPESVGGSHVPRCKKC